ncbi:MAG: glycosyltransferase family 4 protein [Bacteroidales bacterium]|nr:glycosyltransferase family 4 protein [Bacteroidales bacterium]
MKRLLLITYYWPPSGGSGVQRWLKMAKYLPQNGWEVVVYTPSNPDANSTDSSLVKEIPPSIEVIKRKIKEPYSIYKKLVGKKSNEHIQANLVGTSSAKRGFMQRLSLHIRANWFIPDPRCWWIKPSVRFLSKLIKERGEDYFNAIISTGPPHSMHLIARQLHKEFNIPWVADFRDPWTKIFYFKHLGLSKTAMQKHLQLEGEVLQSSNKIVVVSEGMRREFTTGEYAAFAPKVEVITNGYDTADFSTKTNPILQEFEDKVNKIAADKFVIVHTGLLAEDGNPDSLWKTLGKMAKEESNFAASVMIVTMGQTAAVAQKQIEENGLAQNHIELGYVAHSESIAWQKRANLLLLPLRKEKEAGNILTGKFFEYLASGNPILAFGPQDGDLAKILKETGSGTICEWGDEKAIEEVISESDGAVLSGVKKSSCGSTEKYTRAFAAKQYAALLSEITHSPSL